MFGGSLNLQVLPEENETRFIIDLPVGSSARVTEQSTTSPFVSGSRPIGHLKLQVSDTSASEGVTVPTQAALRRCNRNSILEGYTDTPDSQGIATHGFGAGGDDFKPIGVSSAHSNDMAINERHMVEFTNSERFLSIPKQGIRAWTSLESLSCAASLRIARVKSAQSGEPEFTSAIGEGREPHSTDIQGGRVVRNKISENAITVLQEGSCDVAYDSLTYIRRPEILPRSLHGPKKALIVDDVLSNRKLMLRHMRKLFGHIDEAEDGVQAVNCVKRAAEQGSEYDAIFMDFVMPNMDGPTATAEIRSMGFKGPIFGVTGNALTSDIQLFIERGANNVFLKPVDMDALIRALRGNVNFSSLIRCLIVTIL